MKNLLNIKKHYFNYFLIFYFFIGIYLSLKIGITHDEAHSNWVWELNKNKIINIFTNESKNIDFLNTYHGYYGVGFYFISTPLEIIFSKFINFENINKDGVILLLKHPVVFLFFIISGIFFKKIIFLLTNNKLYSNYSTILFLSYPYLLGHSLFNVKDIPVMSVWLISTYFLIKILNDFFYNSKVKKKNIIILSLLTSYLLSLRIAGLLIFLEYFIFLIFYLTVFKFNFFNFLKKNLNNLFLFLLFFLSGTYLFYPSFWEEPLKFINSFLFMSQHIQTACTITLGKCMEAQNLPPSYIFIWLLFKLPVIILFGFLLLPFVEKKLFSNKQNILILGSLLTTIFAIIFLFIFLNVNLYDELRQVLFLIPLIFIISLTILFIFFKKTTLVSLSFFIIFFFIQNFKIFPYNYLWLNNFNIFINVEDNFELDYWGVATRNVANFLNNKTIIKKNSCIISNRNDGIGYFIKNSNICFKSFSDLHNKNERPFYVALLERGLNKGVPNKCKIIHKETTKINFSNENIVLAKIYECI